MSKTKIVIVEDDDLIRNGLQYLLNQAQDYKTIGSFSDAESALLNIEELNPDIVLMDIGLPGMDGIECLKEIKKLNLNCSIIMLTVFEDDDRVFTSILAGAEGYILKKTPPGKIIEILNDLKDGGAPVSSQIAMKMLNIFKRIPLEDETDKLSKREYEILEYIVKGITLKQIADKLFISPKTVRTHLRNIYQKLHVHSKTEAVSKALGSKSFIFK